MSDEIRNVPFAVTRAEPDGDGLTLEGYAAVFDSPTEINSREGHFIERIMPGAFKRTLSHKMPVLMFNHGQHPLIGDMPLGRITEAREDAKGLFISARLSDNWLVKPVRDAIADGAVDGMSFRFSVPKDGDTWRHTRGKVSERDLTQVSCTECGPVVFPAYPDTSVGVRSQLLDALNDEPSRNALAEALFAFRDTALDVAKFADPGLLDDGQARFPLGSATQAMTAWAFIDDPENQEPYSADQVTEIKDRILAAAMQFGFPIEQPADSDESTTATDAEPAPDEGTSESSGMNSNDPPAPRHSLDPDSRERRRQARLLLARHMGVIQDA